MIVARSDLEAVGRQVSDTWPQTREKWIFLAKSRAQG